MSLCGSSLRKSVEMTRIPEKTNEKTENREDQQCEVKNYTIRPFMVFHGYAIEYPCKNRYGRRHQLLLVVHFCLMTTHTYVLLFVANV